ncbi:MAG: carboxypeptidase regulatory-like domain-containing protein, partial [Bacteroidota bacterium]
MKHVFFALLSFFTLYTSAQTIKGKLTNATDGAVPYAAVTLSSPLDSSLVKATISNEEGIYVLKDLQPSEYLFKVNVLGYADLERKINYESGDLDMGTLVLTEVTENLAEVTVVAEKPMVQVMADKTVFNVQNTINATGTSAFELLRKAPGVIVDNNGGIIVEGKSGVQFFIDGKLSVLQGDDLVNFLESLQATDIEAVEIITQPSSKYDAAGNAGIINIKLKKDKSLGTNGTYTSGITTGDFARFN